MDSDPTSRNRIVDEIKIALSFFSEEDGAHYFSGDFFDLTNDLGLESNLSKNKWFGKVSRQLRHAQHDLWNLNNLISRLDWQHSLYLRGSLLPIQWIPFASLDIEHFHVEYRALMDHLAKVIGHSAAKSGSIRMDSFRKLNQWLQKQESNRNRLGQDLVTIVEACSWFPDYRAIRDTILHEGGETLIFLPDRALCFQIYKGWDEQIKAPGVMFSQNVVDFKKYSVLAISRLISVLDVLARAVRERTRPKRSAVSPMKIFGQFDTYLNWADQFLNSEASK